jgi:hypothetical protein
VDGNATDVTEAEFVRLMSIRPKTFTAENEKADLDPDHMFEIPLKNQYLFSGLRLHESGIKDELITGRLFSTRMPRDLTTNPDAKPNFAKRAKDRNLHTVLVLTEPKEYEEYAGQDLEAFYKELGLQVMCVVW